MIYLGKFIVHYYSTSISIYNSTFNQLLDGTSIVFRTKKEGPRLRPLACYRNFIGFQVDPVKRNSQQLGRLCCNWPIEDATVRRVKVFLTFGATVSFGRNRPVTPVQSVHKVIEGNCVFGENQKHLT